MIKRLKHPDESGIDAMLRLSLTFAAGAFMLIYLRMVLSISIQSKELFWPILSLWWFGFGGFFALAWTAFIVAVVLRIKGE